MIDPGAPVTPPPGVPIDIGRDDARRAAADELAKPVYAHARPSLTRRALDWTGHELAKLWGKAFGGGSAGSGDGWTAVVILLVLLVVVVVVIRRRYGPVRRRVTAGRALFDEAAPLDAAGYRRAAEEHAAGGRWAEAVRDRLRAVIAALEERAVLDPRPGRTADVAAREAGAVLPEQAAALAGAARLFDDIWYGQAAAGPEDYRRLVAVDEAVAAARVRVGSAVGAGLAGELPQLAGTLSGLAGLSGPGPSELSGLSDTPDARRTSGASVPSGPLGPSGPSEPSQTSEPR